MFWTFLAVLLALLCHTAIVEALMFYLQHLAIKKNEKFKNELLAKYPDLLSNPGNYMPFYQGHETTSSGIESKYGSGQYL